MEPGTTADTQPGCCAASPTAENILQIMNLELKIIRDLEAGQTTIEALATRVGASRVEVTEILQRLQQKNEVVSFRVMDMLTVWKLRKVKK
jgi:hypothetical protein